MSTAGEEVGALEQRLVGGDATALGPLLDLYRPRLRREIAGDLAADQRLAARFDASDVVQETLLDACRQIDWFLASHERVDFWIWLRGLARERRLKFVRDHLDAQCRTAKRQQALPDESGRHPAALDDSPSSVAEAAEEAERVSQALGRLEPEDRDIIRMRVHDGRTNGDVAALLGTTAAAAAKRLERALRRLREAASDSPEGAGP
jgi:RNA polymerase sigma-70 factor (ECF subfamily)